MSAEEEKAEEVKAKEVKAEEVKAEEVKAEAVKAEEVKAEDVKAEDVKAEEVQVIVKGENDEPVDVEKGDIEDYNQQNANQGAEPENKSFCTPYVSISYPFSTILGADSQSKPCCLSVFCLIRMVMLISVIAAMIVVGGIAVGIYFLVVKDDVAEASSLNADGSGSSASRPLFELNLCGADVDPDVIAEELQIWIGTITSGATVKQDVCPSADTGRRLLAGEKLDFSIVTTDQAARSAFEEAMKNTDAGTEFLTFLMDKACTAGSETMLCRSAHLIKAAIEFTRISDDQSNGKISTDDACKIMAEQTLMRVESTWLYGVDVPGGELDAAAFAMSDRIENFPVSFAEWDNDDDKIISEQELRSGVTAYLLQHNLCPRDQDNAQDGMISMMGFNKQFHVIPPKFDPTLCFTFTDITGPFEEQIRDFGGVWNIRMESELNFTAANLVYEAECASPWWELKYQSLSGRWSNYYMAPGGLVPGILAAPTVDGDRGMVSGANWTFKMNTQEHHSTALIKVTDCGQMVCPRCVSKIEGTDNIEGTYKYNASSSDEEWYSEIGIISSASNSGGWVFEPTSGESAERTNLPAMEYKVDNGTCYPKGICLQFRVQHHYSDSTWAASFKAHFELQSAEWKEKTHAYYDVEPRVAAHYVYRGQGFMEWNGVDEEYQQSWDKTYVMEWIVKDPWGRYGEKGCWRVKDGEGNELAYTYNDLVSRPFKAFNGCCFVAKRSISPVFVTKC